MACMALLCAYMLFPIGFEYFITPFVANVPKWEPLDTSWMLALNYAKINSLTFGEDFAFTYGPLAQLSTRIGWGESKYLFLVFDLFVFVNWLLVFYLSLRQSLNKVLTAVLIAIVALFLPTFPSGKIGVYLLLFLVFWIRQGFEKKTILSYLMQIIIVTLCFYIKFNTALIAFFLMYLGLCYTAFEKGVKYWLLLIYAIVPLLLIYALSVSFNISLVNYVRTGFEMISGYNEIMYEDFPLPYTDIFFNLVTLLFLAVVAFNFISRKEQAILKRLVIAAMALVPFFIIYKQGFVRSNPGYNSDFFTCTLVCFLAIPDFHFWVKGKIIQICVVLAALTSVGYLYILSEKPIEITNKLSKSGYLYGFENFTPDSDLTLKRLSPKFPPSILQKIGRQTVDAYPINLRMLFENNLNYLPRPCLQSYAAYTPHLAEINFSRYNDVQTAPQFVVYEYGALDNRYPLFDETKINIALERNYEVAELFDYDNKKLLLLRKKTNFKSLMFKKTKEYAMMLNSQLVPQKGIFYEIEMYNNLSGKAYGIFMHAPEIKLEIQVKDGARLVFKTSKKLLQTGIYDGNVIENTQDFADIMQKGSSTKSVRFYTFRPMDSDLFKDKIKITEYKITQ